MPLRPRTLVVWLLAGVLPLAGCAKKTTAPGPPGDDAGDHLVAFVTDRSGTLGAGDVGLYDLDAGGFRSVAKLNSAADESEPCLSDDGSFLVFASGRSGAGDLFVYDRLNQ